MQRTKKNFETGCTTQAGSIRYPEGDWRRCIMKLPSVCRAFDTLLVCHSSESGVVAPAEADSKAARLCPSIPPLPRFSFTCSQAISRFFRLYTLSINEWTFLASVRLIQSTSLLRRERTGFSLKELFHPPSSLLIWFPFSS